jgi:hypothetical protein
VWPSIGVARDVLDDPVSTAGMKLAKEWLEECISPTHAGCQGSVETRLPTRVIDLGVEGEHPRLLVTNGTRGKYVTLSHCWGKVSPLVTTKSTLKKRIAGICVAELPKTFQDAILVTHGLGFRYLWIDSLCIVQDSKEDWDIESSRMQDVYACAIFNISADAALDSTSGLGTWRRLPPGIAVGSPKNGDHVRVRPIFDCTDSSGVSHVPRDEEHLKHVLDTRAWVLQERMLSPRILHFSEYEMAWECDTCCRCECTVLPRKPAARSFRSILGDSQLSKKAGLKVWFDLVGKYSTLNLTRESDKLPAVAGLALRAANYLSKTYLAGLWEEDLPYCLLWYVRRGHLVSARLQEYVPSWSWASIRGETAMGPGRCAVSTLQGPTVYKSEIKGLEFNYGGGSVYGSLQYGIIEIKGMKSPVSFDSQHRVIMETPEQTHETVQNVVHPDVTDWSEFQDADDCFLFIISVGHYILSSFLANSLILRPAKQIQGNSLGNTCYRRIGCYQYWTDSWRAPVYSLLKQTQEEQICIV